MTYHWIYLNIIRKKKLISIKKDFWLYVKKYDLLENIHIMQFLYNHITFI